MTIKNIIFGLLLISSLSGCTYTRPTTPEEDEKARKGLACFAEEKLTVDASSGYYSFCLDNFEQRDKALAKLLKTADPLSMCQYETRLDINQSPSVAKERQYRVQILKHGLSVSL